MVLGVKLGVMGRDIFRFSEDRLATHYCMSIEHWIRCRRTYRGTRRMRRRVGADGPAQPPLSHTRSLCTVPRGNPDLIATFLVVDVCDTNSVTTNCCRELDVSCCRVLQFKMADVLGRPEPAAISDNTS